MDFVAKRYGILPSQLLASGASIDFQIADLAVKYESWAKASAEAKARGLPPPVQKSKTGIDELQAMMDQVRGK